jgi:ATP-binding protein involved in chromosome partitioning
MGTNDRPIQVDSMIVPPVAHDVKVISIAQFTQGNTPVVWRGPMLHQALQQFLADVYWGDLDCCSTCRRAPATWRSRSRS